MKSPAATVDGFLLTQIAADRAIFTTLRRLIRTAAPQATETMRYDLPSYELNGMLGAFTRQKNYL